MMSLDSPYDGRQTTDKLRFHELCGHSQAELKITMISKQCTGTNCSHTSVDSYLTVEHQNFNIIVNI